jgi:hypothetical protein
MESREAPIIKHGGNARPATINGRRWSLIEAKERAVLNVQEGMGLFYLKNHLTSQRNG